MNMLLQRLASPRTRDLGLGKGWGAAETDLGENNGPGAC